MDKFLSKYIILGHENPDVDSIISGYLLEKLMLSKGFKAEFIIPDKKIDLESLTICSNFGLNIKEYGYQKDLPETREYKYLLVDHHIRKVNGIIVAVIDHHPDKIGLKIPWYQNELSSSTSCIICREYEEYFNKHDIELAILATMIDTASFHSTKTNELDIIWVKEMCKKYNIDYERLYKAGLCLTDLNNLEEAKLNGLKNYKFNGAFVESSYIQVEDITKISSELAFIIDSLMTYVKENDLKLFVFIVHDMTRFKTTVYDITSKYYNVRSYEFYTSRGNTIMPQTEEAINAKLNLKLK